MKYLIILVILILSSVALSQESEDPLKDFLVQKRPAKDFEIIKENCVISIDKNDEIIAEEKSKTEEVLYTEADDYMFYQASALEFLKKKNVKIITAKTRYLILVMEDEEEIYLDTKLMGWKWVLFNSNKKPQITYPIDMESDYKKYFEAA